MIYCLDTNICIYSLKGKYPSIATHMRKKIPTEIKIPSMVEAELLLGAQKSQNTSATLDKAQKFLAPFEILPFDHEAAEIYSEIRAKLEQEGKIIGPNDLIIAATVLAHHSTLVTHNVKEFSRISGLKIQDWTVD